MVTELKDLKDGVMKKLLMLLNDHYGIEYSKIDIGNGYYLFDFGDGSVCHFKVKGIKRWLFGVWCIFDDEQNEYNVSLFGEHEDYIDKFKPSATELSYSFTLKNDDEINNKIYDHLETCYFSNDIKRIKAKPILEKYFHYSNRMCSVVKFTLSDFMFYRIRKHMDGFVRERIVKWYLHFASFAYKLRFKRRNNKFNANVICFEKNWYPMYHFQVVYAGMDEDSIGKVYDKINKLRKNKNGYKIHKYWFLPKWVSKETRLINAENEEDTRGFYFKNNEENDND